MQTRSSPYKTTTRLRFGRSAINCKHKQNIKRIGPTRSATCLPSKERAGACRFKLRGVLGWPRPLHGVLENCRIGPSRVFAQLLESTRIGNQSSEKAQILKSSEGAQPWPLVSCAVSTQESGRAEPPPHVFTQESSEDRVGRHRSKWSIAGFLDIVVSSISDIIRDIIFSQICLGTIPPGTRTS